jgi:4-alpha-glucanotransferase
MGGYTDARNRWRAVSVKTRDKLRRAMGMNARDSIHIGASDLLLLTEGKSLKLPNQAILLLEDGSRRHIGRVLPRDLPSGYHTLKYSNGIRIHLIIHPRQCQPPKRPQARGWALQLYALRSARSWGIGDFRDLRSFARWSRERLETGFLLLNPLGAVLPNVPIEPSPYFPSSRLFLNPLYLCLEEVDGGPGACVALKKLSKVGRSLNAGRLVNRDKVFRLKQRALEILFASFRYDRRFDEYRHQQGETLVLFAVFCVLTERIGRDWRQWPDNFRKPDSERLKVFAAKHHRRVEFHQWVQWQLDEQFEKSARELPLILDVPIGINAGGFDAWLWQDMLAFDVGMGAPPDDFNMQGQNWGLPPFIPYRLRASGYAPFRQTIRAMLRHARGLRIDHVMGLFRLFWIPHDEVPQAGAYVRNNADELLAVLSIESRRAKSIVVGEDLGTLERGVRTRLRNHGILSYRLFWFERGPTRNFPREALAAISTHDLFTVAGLWSGKDVEEQKHFGLHPDAQRMSVIRRRLSHRADLADTASSREAILGAYELLSRAPCRLLTATLEDALAVEERPNIPGIERRSNWCIALPKLLEAIQRDAFFAKLAETLGSKHKRGTSRRRVNSRKKKRAPRQRTVI